MAPLTEDQIAYIRAKSGDDCTPPTVSDATMQVYYAANDNDIVLTIVSVLQDRWADANAEVSRLSDLSEVVSRANIEHIKNLLDYWERMAGVSGRGRIRLGVLDLGLNEPETSEWG